MQSSLEYNNYCTNASLVLVHASSSGLVADTELSIKLARYP